MIQCTRCGFEQSDAGITTVQPVYCPSCSSLLSFPLRPGNRALSWVKNYFCDVWEILSNPTLFFQKMPLQGGLSRPLGFALVTHWMGASAAFLWHLVTGGPLMRFFEKVFQTAWNTLEVDSPGSALGLFQTKERIVNWLFGAGPVIIDPFITLSILLFTSFFVFVGARILVTPGKSGAPQEISFESAVRITSFGMTPAILAVFPIFGGMAASFYTVVVTVIGAKQVYRVGTGRASLIALFPKLIIPGIIFLSLVILALSVIKFFI